MIDHLGHMNVRYYGAAARAASDERVRRFGGAGDLSVDAVDLYTRHFREQLLGADLEVRSAVLHHGGGSMRVYHELRNTETEDLAARFVHRLEARDRRGPVAAWQPAAEMSTGEMPGKGRPRRISVETAQLDSAPTREGVAADPLL